MGITLLSGATAWPQTTSSPPFLTQSVQDGMVLSRVDSALNYAAKRAGAAFVLEGEPFIKTLSPTDLQAINPNAPLDEFIAQIALAYDYEASRQKNGAVYVLKKRYTNPDDLPFITMGEADAALRDMSQLLAPFRVSDTDSSQSGFDTFRDFAAALSPEQKAAMKNSAQGLAIRDVSPVQRERLWRIVLNFYAQASDSRIRQIEKQLASVRSDPDAVIGKEGMDTQRNIPWFGYSIAWPGAVRPRLFRAMNRTNLLLPGGNGAATSFSVRNMSDAPDQTLPTAAGQKMVVEKRNEPTLAISLREAVRQTQFRDPDAVLPVVVAEEIADKPVVLVNASTAPPQDILRALTESSGLLLVQQNDGTQYLKRPRVPLIKNLIDLPQALQDLMPVSFGRALHWREGQSLDGQVRLARTRLLDYRRTHWNALSGAAVAGGTQPQQPKAANSAVISPATETQIKESVATLEKELALLTKQQQNAVKRPEDLRWASVRYLRTVIEPRLKTEAKPTVSIASLGNEEKVALANFFLTDLWLALSERIANPAPNYVTHFDDGFVVGGPMTLQPSVPRTDGSGNRQGITLSFYYRSDDGKLRNAGLGMTHYEMPGK